MDQSVFITVPYSTLKNRASVKEELGFRLNILIDSNEIDLAFIVSMFSQANSEFIYSLSGSLLNRNNTEAFLNKIYTVFTLSKCLNKRFNNIPIFNMPGVDQPVNLQQVKNYFQLQGEHEIELVSTRSENCIVDQILFSNLSHLNSLDEKQLESYSHQKVKQLILLIDNEDSVEENIQTFKSVVNKNRLISILLELIATKNIADRGLHQSALWENRSKLYLSFINLSKTIGEKEYDDIKHWYHKEYEVLPLWFKRMGHIVKVFTGKRSLKSLFRHEESPEK